MNIEQFAESVKRWVDHGVEPGSFTLAVLRNDLDNAVRRADPESRALLMEFIDYLWRNAPRDCWGSEARVVSWGLLHRDRRQKELRESFRKEDEALAAKKKQQPGEPPCATPPESSGTGRSASSPTSRCLPFSPDAQDSGRGAPTSSASPPR